MNKQRKKEIQELVKMRDNAIIEAVMNDNWEPCFAYFKKYKIMIPPDEKIMKAGIYKAAHEITTMPEDVKLIADKKCVDLGFKVGIAD